MDVSTIHTAIYRMVDEQDESERRRQAGIVASEIVSAFNRAANRSQVALSDTEEVFFNKIDAFQEQLGQSNLLSSQVLLEIQKVLAVSEAGAARLGKHEEEITRLAAVQSDHGERLDELKNIEDWRTGVDTRLSAIEQADRDDIRAEIKSTNAEIVIMKEMLARYDTDLKELVDRLAARGGDEERNGARKEVAPGG